MAAISKPKCNKCDSTESEEHYKWLTCDTCANSFHSECIGMEKQIKNAIIKARAHVMWICPDCKHKSQETLNASDDTRITATNESDISALQQEMHRISARINALEMRSNGNEVTPGSIANNNESVSGNSTAISSTSAINSDANASSLSPRTKRNNSIS